MTEINTENEGSVTVPILSPSQREATETGRWRTVADFLRLRGLDHDAITTVFGLILRAGRKDLP
jgi:hypothetical protein